MKRAHEMGFQAYADTKTLQRIVDFDCVTQMWEHCAAAYADHIALQTASEQVRYGELNARVALFRGVLLSRGVSEGCRVGLYMPNSIDFIIGYLAVTTLGAVAMPLPMLGGLDALEKCMKKFELRAVITSSAADLKGDRPEYVIDICTEAAAPSPSVMVTGDAPCSIMLTGGTTGKSKGSLLSNRAVMCGTRNGCYGYSEVFHQRYLLILPLTHVFGLIRSCLTALYTGSTLYICADNRELFRDIALFKPTILVLVPALAEMALKLSAKFKRNMLGEDLRYIICGAAFVPPYLIKRYHEMGIALLPGYGLTESANLVSGNPEALSKPASVGIIYPGMTTRIVDGELWLKGENMQMQYVGADDAQDAYEDGWFKTGDLVTMDEEGFLYIVGRKKEIIVLPTGENVSPAELEAKFSAIDLISDCLIYEDEGQLTLEVMVREIAAVESGTGDAQESIREQVSLINQKLPSYMRINKLIFREIDFVRSSSMKIVREKNGKGSR